MILISKFYLSLRFGYFWDTLYNLIGTYAYLNNITVCRRDDCDHNASLKSLSNAAKCEGLTFNKWKCLCLRREIDLLGYRASHHKIKPYPERLRPLMQFPLPTTKSESQRTLGMFSY